MDWTEDTISRLRALWNEGLSTAEIGRRLSVSKNAVVGKAHRLTLPARPSPIRRSVAAAAEGTVRRQPARTARPAPITAALPAEPSAAPPPPLVSRGPAAVMRPTLVQPSAAPPVRVETAPDLDPGPPRLVASAPRRAGQTCCWPLGDPGTKQFRFCGGEPLVGKPYCAEHAQLAYVRLRDRRDTVA